MNELEFHVYDQGSDLVSAFRTPEDAAMYIGCVGDGYSIEHKGITVWREGQENMSAAMSYDNVAEVVYSRIKS